MTAARASAFVRDRIIFATLGTLILWACYAASILLGDGTGTFNLKRQLVTADHLAFYTAARLMNEGHAGRVYDNQFVGEYQANLFPPTGDPEKPFEWRSLEAFRNPPFYALPYRLTASYPFRHSAWAWSAVSLACLVGGVYLLSESNWTRNLWWAASFYPVFCTFTYGQNSLLSFAVFAATYRLLAHNRPFAAGLVAGLLLFKPQLFLGLAVWGLLDIRRLGPAAVGVVVTGAALVGGSYAVVPEAWAGFVDSFGKNVAFHDFEQWKMHNPLAFWRLLLPGLTAWHGPLAAAVSVAVIARFVQVWRRRPDLPAAFGMAVFITLLASPHALIYEWALLVVPGVLFVREWDTDRDRWFLLYAASWAVLFVGTNFSELQEMASPVVVQVSVPVMGYVYWRAGGLLVARGARPLAFRGGPG